MCNNRDIDTIISFKDKLERDAVKGIRQDENCERYESSQAIADISRIINKVATSAYNNGALDASMYNESLYIKGLNDAWNTQREIDKMNMFERQEVFGIGKTNAVEITAENDAIEAMHKVLEWKKKKICKECHSRRDSDYCEQNDDFCSCVDAFNCNEVSINDRVTKRSYREHEDIDSAYAYIMDKIMYDTPIINKLIKSTREDTLDDIYVVLMNTADIYFTKDNKKVASVVFNKAKDIYRKGNAIYVHLRTDGIDNKVGYINGLLMDDTHGVCVYKKDFAKEYVNENKIIDVVINIH